MDIQTNDLGDNDSAHALAFGMCEYFLLPHNSLKRTHSQARVYDGAMLGNHIVCDAGIG